MFELLLAVKEKIVEAQASRLTVRFFRYSVGSVVAVVTSEVTFVLCYGTGWLGTTAASVVAFLAGAVPNYVLNRSWAWERRGRLNVSREVILYAVVSIVSLVSAAVVTGWVSRIAAHVTGSGSHHSRGRRLPGDLRLLVHPQVRDLPAGCLRRAEPRSRHHVVRITLAKRRP